MLVRPVPAGFPRFRRHLCAEVGETDVFLFGEHGVTVLRGAQVAALATLLDGSRDAAALVRARPGEMDAEQVMGLLGQLAEAGLIAFGGPGASPEDPASAWWDACGIDAGVRARPGRVGLTTSGPPFDTAPFEAAHAAAGSEVVLTHGPVPDTVDLGVVLCTDYLDPELAAVDAAYRAAGRPWLLAKADGARVWLGPVFGPEAGGCWHCLSYRLWSHRWAEAVVQESLGRHGPAPRPASSVPPVTAVTAHLIALEASKWLAGYRYAGQRCVWIFDTHDLSGERHELRARPQCPVCGDLELVAENTLRPVRLRSAPKVGSGGGGDRTLTTSEVLARYRHLVSPVTGIIKQVVPDPHVPSFAHAYRSGANVSRQVSGLSSLRRSLRSENGGKGLTALDAEVGALCEAVERFSGIRQGDERRLPGSLRSLGTRAVDPRECLLFDERQYATRSEWNTTRSPSNHVPRRFDPDLRLDWTPLWSLTDERHRLLPTAMLYYGGVQEASLPADSNGCAAGSSLEDAVLQGTLELVERDAVALWWYNRTAAPEVDLSAFGDSRFEELRGHHEGIGREIRVLDVTSDLGVPVMVAVSRRTDAAGERILLGFGAHLDPATALRRALAEVNQMLPVDHIDPVDSADPDWAHWARFATVANQPYLTPDRSVAPYGPADFTHVRRDDVRDDVVALVTTLAEHGLETLVLDQTRPDVGLPVVRVVVPGLRSFWSRYAPGRLFDVPVEMGRLSRPTAYDELNPLPLFM